MKEIMNNPIKKLPAQAQVVIIGGGVIGCNIAYCDVSELVDHWFNLKFKNAQIGGAR